MKRSLVALVTLALLLGACATATAPAVSGVISSINGNTVTVTPANGQPTTVTLNWGTRVFHPNGLEAEGTSVLTVGQNVQVYLSEGSQNAARINIGR